MARIWAHPRWAIPTVGPTDTELQEAPGKTAVEVPAGCEVALRDHKYRARFLAPEGKRSQSFPLSQRGSGSAPLRYDGPPGWTLQVSRVPTKREKVRSRKRAESDARESRRLREKRPPMLLFRLNPLALMRRRGKAKASTSQPRKEV